MKSGSLFMKTVYESGYKRPFWFLRQWNMSYRQPYPMTPKHNMSCWRPLQTSLSNGNSILSPFYLPSSPYISPYTRKLLPFLFVHRYHSSLSSLSSSSQGIGFWVLKGHHLGNINPTLILTYTYMSVCKKYLRHFAVWKCVKSTHRTP